MLPTRLSVLCAVILLCRQSVLFAHGHKLGRPELVRAWQTYANSGGRDEKMRKLLLDSEEHALEVLLDLVYGPPKVGTPEQEKRLARLLTRRAHSEFQVREAASRDLLGARDLHSLLERFRNHPDAEVAGRLRAVLGPKLSAEELKYLQDRLVRPATQLLRTVWSYTQMKNVTMRNLDRLAQIENVPHYCPDRVVEPLLATLRYSPDPNERDLLGKFAVKARPGAAVVALGLMTDRSWGGSAAEWLKKQPVHRYDRFAKVCMDVKRPKVLKAAVMVAMNDGNCWEPRPEVVPHIYAAIAQAHDEELRQWLWGTLYYRYADDKARKHFVRQLFSPDDEVFEAALYDLSECWYLDQGRYLLPAFRFILRSKNRQRRLAVLGRLKMYWGEKTTALMAKEATRFLASADAKERKLAQAHFIHLLNSNELWLFQGVQTSDPDPDVRAALTKLWKDWKKTARK